MRKPRRTRWRRLQWRLFDGDKDTGVMLMIRLWPRMFKRMTPEDWLALVVMLQKQSTVCIAKEDRKFLGDMVNVLTLNDPPYPLDWQRKWILTLKKECRL